MKFGLGAGSIVIPAPVSVGTARIGANTEEAKRKAREEEKLRKYLVW